MHLLPSEQKIRIKDALAEFADKYSLTIYEPCNCSSRISHNNGGNYHQIIYLAKDGDKCFAKFDTTCELVPEAKWQECDDPRVIIEENADWL